MKKIQSHILIWWKGIGVVLCDKSISSANEYLKIQTDLLLVCGNGIRETNYFKRLIAFQKLNESLFNWYKSIFLLEKELN